MKNTLQRLKNSSLLGAAPLVRLTLVAATVLMISPGQSQSQQICDQITESLQDSIVLVSATGKPGDTVWVPVWLKTDSTMSGFSMLIKWDETQVSPLTVFDPVDSVTRMVTQLAGRFVQLDQFGTDTTTNFFAQFSLNPFDSGAILAGYNLSPGDTVITTPPGAGVIFRIAFRLFGTMQQDDSALIRFYEIQPIFVANPPIVLDCRRTELSVDWNNTGVPVTLYTTLIDGYIIADLTPDPTIVQFDAKPDTIQEGGSSSLVYEVTNADSIMVAGGGITIRETTNFHDSISVSPTVNTTYTLTAYNEFATVDSVITITVVPDTGGVVDAPVISFPDGSVHTIEQGQTVSFRVTATDPNVGDIVELRAINLPNNAAFSTVVGTNTVSGNFSFTPDVNQEGTFVVQFVATDNGGASNTSQASITVVALQFDRLFSTSALGQSPVGGLAGKKDIVFPINMVTSQTVYGVQFDLLYDHRAITVDSFKTTPRTKDYTISHDLGAVPGRVLVVAYGLANDSIVIDSNSTAVLNAFMSIDTSAVPWADYLIDMRDGWESINPDPDFPSLQMVTEGGVVQVDKPGDVNLDKRIDVADLVNIVAAIIGNFSLSSRQFETADIVRDASVNVFDLVGTVNTIFGIPVSPAPPTPVSGRPAVLALDYPNLQPGQLEIMTIKSDLPEKVAGAELDIVYDPLVVVLGVPSLGADAAGMVLQYKNDGRGNMKVLLHFTNPRNLSQLLPVGDVEMVKVPLLAARSVEAGNTKQIKIGNALLSTSAAAAITVEGFDDEPLLPETFELFQNYPNPFNPTTTIEFTIGQSKDGALTQHTNLDIFNILGQQVNSLVDDELPAGYYRVEWDARSRSGHRVSSGVYFYRLIVGPESQTKKMLLLK